MDSRLWPIESLKHGPARRSTSTGEATMMVSGRRTSRTGITAISASNDPCAQWGQLIAVTEKTWDTLTSCGTRRMFGHSFPTAEVVLGRNMVSRTFMVSGFR